MNYFFVTAKVVGTPEADKNKVLELLVNLEEKTNNEAGCHYFKVMMDPQKECDFVFWEVFESAEALARHFEYDYTRKVLESDLLELEWSAVDLQPINFAQIPSVGK